MLERRTEVRRAERTEEASSCSEVVIREEVDWEVGMEGLVPGANLRDTKSWGMG